jgi:hypothetical protein
MHHGDELNFEEGMARLEELVKIPGGGLAAAEKVF